MNMTASSQNDHITTHDEPTTKSSKNRDKTADKDACDCLANQSAAVDLIKLTNHAPTEATTRRITALLVIFLATLAIFAAMLLIQKISNSTSSVTRTCVTTSSNPLDCAPQPK
ncbi:hypothetical protein IKF15_04210 [Candidatus Saccharibacteria bacterium]|nr:hypothetical protein [Candidatus Saccharibacteria bacterium]